MIKDEILALLVSFLFAVGFVWLVVFVWTDPDFIINSFRQFMRIFE